MAGTAREHFANFPVDDLEHLPEISTYNHNYYRADPKRLLFGKSDDDNFTAWYLVLGDKVTPLGGSYISDDTEVILTDEAYT